MKKITITNVSSATVVITVPDIRFRRELVPGRTIGITESEYEDLMFDTGFNNLISGHYIVVNGVEEGQKEIETEKVFDVKMISKMLDNHDVTSFAKFIPNAASAEKETAVQLAIEKGITDNGIVALINKYCGVDIIKAINTKHLIEEK